MRIGLELDGTYHKLDTFETNYGQDRKAMRLGDFTGIGGFPHQDIAMWETMGRIADRSHERLGASDVAIVEFRRILVKALRAFVAGEPALGTQGPRGPRADKRSFEGVIPKATDWRTLGGAASEAEDTLAAAE